jgi:hypothetical protein
MGLPGMTESAAVKKVAAYFEKIGFKHVTDTDFWILASTHTRPSRLLRE